MVLPQAWPKIADGISALSKLRLLELRDCCLRRCLCASARCRRRQHSSCRTSWAAGEEYVPIGRLPATVAKMPNLRRLRITASAYCQPALTLLMQPRELMVTHLDSEAEAQETRGSSALGATFQV